MPAKRPQGGNTGRGSYGKKDGKYSDRGGKKESTYGDRDKKFGDRKSSGSKSGYEKKSYSDSGSDRKRSSKSFGDRDKKFGDKKSSFGSKGGYEKKSYGDDGYERKKSDKSFGDRDKKFGDKKSSFGSKGGYEKKSYGDSGYERKKSDKSFGDRDKKFGDKKSSFGSKGGYEKKYGDEGYERKKSVKSFNDRDKSLGDKKTFGSKSGYEKKSYGDDGFEHKKSDKSFGGREKKFGDKKTGGFKRKEEGEWVDRKKSSPGDIEGKKTPRKRNDGYKTDSFSTKKPYGEDELSEAVDYTEKKKSFEKKKGEYDKMIRKSEKNYGKAEKKSDGTVRLNKYLSNSGVASRRDADRLIESGAVTVNGVVVTELGTKVKLTDKIQYGGQSVKTEKLVYILLNKPKDYITTMDDPQGRKTVMSLIRGAAKERVYPVGRLDRNTTGVILFTNDGDLTRRLTHPKFLVSKMYHVTLDKNFAKEHLDAMRKGLELEDGYIKPDQLEYSGETKAELGIEIHSGRNRIVRRMFEHLGYDVVKLDRVQFAGLNKKDIPRGKWRFLSEKEVGFLKML